MVSLVDSCFHLSFFLFVLSYFSLLTFWRYVSLSNFYLSILWCILLLLQVPWVFVNGKFTFVFLFFAFSCSYLSYFLFLYLFVLSCCSLLISFSFFRYVFHLSIFL